MLFSISSPNIFRKLLGGYRKFLRNMRTDRKDSKTFSEIQIGPKILGKFLVKSIRCRWGNSNSQSLGYKPRAPATELNSLKLVLERSRFYPDGVLHHYIFVMSRLWLTSHLRIALVLLDTPSSMCLLCWYQEYLCPVEPMFSWDDVSITDEK